MAIQTKKTSTGTDVLTLEVAKEWLRITDDPSADDPLITTLIKQSRDLIEHYLNIAITECTVVLTATLRDKLSLQFRPINSITEVQDRDANDLSYSFDGFTITLDSPSDVVVTYEAGYASGDLPEGLLLGWMEVLTGLYENRGDRLNTDFRPEILIRMNPNLAAYNKQKWFK